MQVDQALPRRRYPGDVEQVIALIGLQPQCPGQGGQHLLRRLGAAALLQAYDVVDADPGELGELLASQAGHSAVPAHREPDLGGPDTLPGALDHPGQLLAVGLHRPRMPTEAGSASGEGGTGGPTIGRSWQALAGRRRVDP